MSDEFKAEQELQQQQQLAELRGGSSLDEARRPRDPNEPLTRPVDDWIDATWPRCIASCLKVHPSAHAPAAPPRMKPRNT